MEIQHASSPVSQQRPSKAQVFSSGRDFYDDGYTEEEQNINNLPSTVFPSASAMSNSGRNIDDGKAGETSDPSGSSNGGAPWRESSCFLGREPELEQLRNLKKQIIEQDQNVDLHAQEPSNESGPTAPTGKPDVHPAVLLWGISGTGKSALVDHFLATCCTCNSSSEHQQQQQQQQQQMDNEQTAAETSAATPPTEASSSSCCTCCYIVRGKSDECTGQSSPFSAIIQAIEDFTAQLKRGPKSELNRLRECIRVAFPTGGFRPLVTVIPSLSILSPKPARADASVTSNSASYRVSLNGSQINGAGSSTAPNEVFTENTWNQLQYIFVQFIKAISTKERPIYMFLDDLQWSASIGLDLLVHLVADRTLKHFMLLGAIRQETNPHTDEPLELAPDHPLSQCLVKPLSSVDAQEDGQTSDINDEGSTRTESTPRSQSNDRRRPRTLHQIALANLTLAEMTAWLSTMLERDDVQDLSRKIYRKTDGNIFFTLQVLRELERKNILVFSRISFQWEWNIAKPAEDERSNASSAQLPVSDNVIGLIESNIRDLPKQLRQILCIAAYIRSMFEISVLHRVLENELKHVDGAFEATKGAFTTQDLSNLLERAVLERLISNPIGGTKYHFAHDRIQQAAHGMIPYGEARDKLRLRIGRCLLRLHRTKQEHMRDDEHKHEFGYAAAKSATANVAANNKAKAVPSRASHTKTRDRAYSHDRTSMCSQSTHSATSAESSISGFSVSGVDDGLLFVAADHLNSVQTKDHMFSVTMNLEVGEKALEMAALQAAATYLQKAHAALRRVRIGASHKTAASQAATSQSIWDSDEHYDVCLKVYRARADVELSLGNYELGYSLCDEVLEKARSMDDKTPTYFSMARALGRENRHAETLDVELRVLRSLKSFPKRWYMFHIAKAMVKLRSFLKKNTNEEILARPWMTDPTKKYVMKISADFAVCTKSTNNMLLVVLNLCKMLSTTMKYGICKESAGAFVTYGLVVGGMGDQATADRCAELAHTILDQADGKTAQGQVRFITGWYIIPFKASFPGMLREFRRGYLDSLEVGEFDMGIINYQACAFAGFSYGLELGPLQKAAEAALGQMSAYKIKAFSGIAEHLQIMLRYFTEQQAINWPELDAASRRNVITEDLNQSEVVWNCMFFHTRSVLALFHRRYEMSERLLNSFLTISEGEPSYLYILAESFFGGLIAAGKYREKGNRRELANLRRRIKRLRHVANTRGRIWIHQVLLLEAEELAITTKNKVHSKIEHAYNIAIIAATQAGCIHEAALANEMAGEHFAQHGSKAMVGDYFVHAVDYYKAWGGKSKVTDIKQRRKKYLKTLNDPYRQRPEGLTNDGDGNYLFGITKDPFTGAITSRCTELDAFADRSKHGAGAESSGDALQFGSGFNDAARASMGLEDDDVSVLTDM